MLYRIVSVSLNFTPSYSQQDLIRISLVSLGVPIRFNYKYMLHSSVHRETAITSFRLLIYYQNNFRKIRKYVTHFLGCLIRKKFNLYKRQKNSFIQSKGEMSVIVLNTCFCKANNLFFPCISISMSVRRIS